MSRLSIPGDSDPYSSFVDSLPFGQEYTVKPVFTSEYIACSLGNLAHRDKPGIAAAFDDYYGRGTYRFISTDDPTEAYPVDHIADIPRSNWEQWNIVSSRGETYAEPVATEKLERGAIATGAQIFIDTLRDDIKSAGLTDEELAQNLFKLGFKPIGFGVLEAIEADGIRTMRLEESVVVVNSDNPSFVVHTPRVPVRPKVYVDRKKLFHHQGEGIIDSVRFNPDGTYQAEGCTQELRYERAGIPRAQAKFLRRFLSHSPQLKAGLHLPRLLKPTSLWRQIIGRGF